MNGIKVSGADAPTAAYAESSFGSVSGTNLSTVSYCRDQPFQWAEFTHTLCPLITIGSKTKQVTDCLRLSRRRSFQDC